MNTVWRHNSVPFALSAVRALKSHFPNCLVCGGRGEKTSEKQLSATYLANTGAHLSFTGKKLPLQQTYTSCYTNVLSIITVRHCRHFNSSALVHSLLSDEEIWKTCGVMMLCWGYILLSLIFMVSFQRSKLMVTYNDVASTDIILIIYFFWRWD